MSFHLEVCALQREEQTGALWLGFLLHRGNRAAAKHAAGTLLEALMVAFPGAPYLLAPHDSNAQKHWQEVGKKSHSEKLYLSRIAKLLKYRCNLLPFYLSASISPLIQEEDGFV